MFTYDYKNTTLQYNIGLTLREKCLGGLDWDIIKQMNLVLGEMNEGNMYIGQRVPEQRFSTNGPRTKLEVKLIILLNDIRFHRIWVKVK